MEMTEEVMDLRGLKCPLPALLVRRRLAAAAPDTVLAVLTDDPMAPVDIPHMCRGEGFECLKVERQADQARIVVRRP
jgi:tRNA 2-thiouridine synthesizing protein A